VFRVRVAPDATFPKIFLGGDRIARTTGFKIEENPKEIRITAGT